jgi:uncharacterized protein with predicted RNA binding PUA domain
MHSGVGLSGLQTAADYQFGAGAGAALFPPGEEIDVERSRNGRPKRIRIPGGRIASVGAGERFTLGVEGGRRLIESLPAPAGRVVVGDESEPFVREGRNVFAKFVDEVGPEVRARDEVAVVHEGGDLLAVGRAELDAGSMRDFASGVAVKVRSGVEKPDE